ncbi:MAG: 50S ribosomal protein L9 [Alphaproteobacteria bacterium]|nr:50S ribosomal protein L9 [Alphaproteobacteria bacterium]
MATQVILLERVEKLGGMGDVISVKSGYARNYLLPQKKALRASEQNIAYFEAQKKKLEAESVKGQKDAEKLAKKLSGIKVPLIRQASESGHLYGSVTSRDIAAEITEVSKETIRRDMVLLNQSFKSIGFYPVEISLHPEVKVEVTINIARSVEEAEIQAKTGHALITDEAVKTTQKEQDIPDEADLKEVLEEGALEVEKEKQEAEAVKAEKDAIKEAEQKVKAEAKAEIKAAEEAAAVKAALEEAEDNEQDITEAEEAKAE